ncbi:hypothetical protein [Streptomyces fradiae]
MPTSRTRWIRTRDHEARELATVLPQGRIVHLGLPEHERLTMC